MMVTLAAPQMSEPFLGPSCVSYHTSSHALSSRLEAYPLPLEDCHQPLQPSGLPASELAAWHDIVSHFIPTLLFQKDST